MKWRRMPFAVLFGFWILFVLDPQVVLGLECAYPGSPASGRPHPLKEIYRPGDAVTFTCTPGHSLQGPLQRVCGHNGTWTPPALPLCDRSLSSVDHQASSRQTLSLYPAEKSVDGDPRTCTYTDKLRPRWIRLDMRTNQRVRAVAITVPQGIYSQDAAQLTIYAISVRDSTTASYHKCATFNGRFASSTLQLSCAGGEVEGRYIHVEDNRHRVDYFSLCEINVFINRGTYECGEAERPAHSYSVRTTTDAVEYKCVYGFRLEGPSIRICQQNGQWTPQQPVCKEILCPVLDDIPNGRLQYAGMRKTEYGLPTLATTANVTCDYGYQQIAAGPQLICQEDGRWSKGNLTCQPIDCGVPVARHESEQYILLNGTRYGSAALLQCHEDQESLLVCREDGTWSPPSGPIDCAPVLSQPPSNGVSTLGLVEDDQNDVPTGVVIGMAVVVFLLLIAVISVLLLKRKKVLRQNSTESLPSKETTTSTASPQPYDNDSFYATIPVDNPQKKNSFMSTILFPRRKSSPDSGNSSSGCIYEEIGSTATTTTQPGAVAAETVPRQPIAEAVYAQVDLEEKRRSRLTKPGRFDPVDPPDWKEKPEDTYCHDDEVDLEPIKLRELPPIPPDENCTYASLAFPLEPPDPTFLRKNEIYEESRDVIMKDNELYLNSSHKV